MEKEDKNLRSQIVTSSLEQNQLIKTKENNIEVYDKEKIRSMIYEVRGKQVMLDSDVAMLYHYETKRINETVSRNKERFPEHFCFQLTEEEINCLRLQFATLNKGGRGQHKKYLPYVFTEQGIAMLSGLLKNDIAVRVSIRTSIFHDRFIVIDNKDLYHIGASLKDLGKKCFGINKIEDTNFIQNIENNIKNSN